MASNGAQADLLHKVKPTTTSESAEAEAAMGEQPVTSNHRLVQRGWLPRFWDQFTVLSRKQVLVYFRNFRATLLRIFAPLFFMFLLWLLNLAFRADNVALDYFSNYPDPSVTPMPAIPACDTDMYIRQPCLDFIYSPNTSSVAQSVVDAIRANNPGRPIPSDAVLGFASIADANTYLLDHPESALGGVHFLLDANGSPSNPGALEYVLQSNFTTKFFKGNFQDPTFFAAVPLQGATEAAIAAYQWQQAGRSDPLQWNVSYSQFAHPSTGNINIVGQAMGPFVFAANMFNFVLLLGSIVAERERGLRQALTTSGMLDSAFWLSWLVVELVISVLFTLLLIGFGAMFGFAFFLHNDFSVIFLLFLLFQWAMIGIAFILSAFVSKTSTAINLGFVVFLLGWVIQAAIAFDFPYSPDYYKKIPALTVIFTLIPPAPLAKGAIDLGLAADRGGISFSRRSAYCQNVKDPSTADALYAANKGYYLDTSCVFPLGTILSVLAVEFFVYVLIGIYLDNVVADSNGVKKKPWYLLSPVYWCGGMRRRGSARRKLRPPVACPVESGEADVDVAAEEAAMKELILHRTGTAGALAAAEAVGGGAAKNAVEVFGLQKVFGRGWFAGCCGSCCGGIKWFLCCCGCCSCCRRSGRRTQPKRSREFWAIKGSWFSIRRDQLFCLLGPNGAGKTTTINCLTGVLPPSGGDALVYGESINAPGGLDRIRAVMGVCPQFDVQWAELTGAEHLFIYGRVKGLSRKNVAAQSAELLESVKLTAAKDQRTGQYSGGMRRRLSVAIALLGDPLVVYLDEPTTGMDPISRRHVWDAIEAAKPGRAIVLTTHSMEEADILGDTIAIMARGKLRAYGSSLRLKQRFGSGYQISVAVSGAPSADAVKAAFAEELGVSIVEDATGHYLVFHVPKAQEAALPAFLKRLEAKSAELGIVDLQISLTSLEEVFLNIARKAELEAAAAEGRSDVAVTLEDGTALDVPLGAEEAVQESTGRRYAIKWAQDEEGSLQVLSWTLLASNGPAAVAPAPENGMARGT